MSETYPLKRPQIEYKELRDQLVARALCVAVTKILASQLLTSSCYFLNLVVAITKGNQCPKKCC